MSDGEVKIYGQHACRAVFDNRPQDIVRVLLLEEQVARFRPLLKHCAESHKPYRVVPDEELQKVSGARHHEGICLVARVREVPSLATIVGGGGDALILALDKVGNPHNIGTLLRTAAHFGVRAVLFGSELKRLSSAAYRTAEGAAEKVDTIFTKDLGHCLSECTRAGFVVCATSSHKGTSLYGEPLPKRAVMLLGSERDGLSRPLMQQAEQVRSIPGSSQVESLNVAASVAVLLAEHWRQYPSGKQKE